jgi:RNA polymerase sigma factor (sigma-70 family)
MCSQYLPLKQYLRDARNFLRKYCNIRSKDSDAIAYVAYYGMMADKRYDPEKSADRDAYRNLNYKFAVKNIKSEYVKYKDCLIKSLDFELSENTNLYNFLEAKSSDVKSIIDREYIDYLLNNSSLSDRDQEMIRMYFFDNATMSEIATKYNISKNRVSVIINKSLDKIKEANE